MSRFDHLKRDKIIRPTSLDEFIADAEAKPIKRKPRKEDILLIITGRMENKERDCEKPAVNLFLKKNLANDIQRHCQGHKQSILHYLIETGLKTLKEKNEQVIVLEE